MGWAGCYTLDLYCDESGFTGRDDVHAWGEFPHQFTAELGTRCRERARKAGWLIRGSKAWCPKCNPKSPHYVKR